MKILTKLTDPLPDIKSLVIFHPTYSDKSTFSYPVHINELNLTFKVCGNAVWVKGGSIPSEFVDLISNLIGSIH